MHEALLQKPTCPTNKGAGGRCAIGAGAELLLGGCPPICPATCPCPCIWAGTALCAGSTELLPKVAAPGMGRPLGGWDPGGGGVPGFPLMALTRPAEKGRLPPPRVLRGCGPFSAAGCSTGKRFQAQQGIEELYGGNAGMLTCNTLSTGEARHDLNEKCPIAYSRSLSFMLE